MSKSTRAKVAAIAAAAVTVLAAIGELDRADAVFPVTDKAIEVIKFVLGAFVGA